ncbi:hypothetical protein K1T71_013934 [Dendrolimus kikuchii]|uniref:Uncharacterized protein n=1 Tax=Dendrolimus kikuchii TaxID=765133 RepID=A0ACC1CGC1_9NEOP|nr:hypothetical protein K1T71_013934 [Dendrolimus kikuchii]
MLVRIKMKYIFALVTILATSVKAIGICHACIDGAAYTRVPIFENIRLSGQLAIDKTANIVYFHYEDSETIDHTASFDLDDIRFKIIPGISFSFARTVDQNTREVYMGGATGLYKYNPSTNRTEQVGLLDKTILDLQYKGKILYTIFKTKGLFIYEKQKSKSITQLSNYTIDFFVIDKKDDIYFISDGKVHRLKKGSKKVELFLNDFYVLSVDNYNGMYFVHPASHGIYSLNYKSDKLMRIGAFANGLPTKIVFDSSNNMIYLDANVDKLYYLMPNFGKCKVTRGIKRNKYRVKNPSVLSRKNIPTFDVQSIK